MTTFASDRLRQIDDELAQLRGPPTQYAPASPTPTPDPRNRLQQIDDELAQLYGTGPQTPQTSRTAPTTFQPLSPPEPAPPPPTAPDSARYVQTRYGDLSSTPVQPQFNRSRELMAANVLGKIRTDEAQTGNRDFSALPYEQQISHAQAVVDKAMAGEPWAVKMVQGTADQQTQLSAARLQAAAEGKYTYGSDEERSQDMQTVEAGRENMRQRMLQAKAEEQGPIGSFALSAADTASFGQGKRIREGGLSGAIEQLTPMMGPLGLLAKRLRPQEPPGENAGLEEATARAYPVQSTIGSLVGGFPAAAVTAGGGAELGATVARGMGLKGLGTAVAAEGAGLLTATTAQMPVAAINTLQDGGTLNDAVNAAGQTAAQYELIRRKIVNGEKLANDDWLALAMLAPMTFGPGKAVLKGFKEGVIRHATSEKVLLKALNQEIQKTQVFMDQPEVAQNKAFMPGPPEAPAGPMELIPNRPDLEKPAELPRAFLPEDRAALAAQERGVIGPEAQAANIEKLGRVQDLAHEALTGPVHGRESVEVPQHIQDQLINFGGRSPEVVAQTRAHMEEFNKTHPREGAPPEPAPAREALKSQIRSMFYEGKRPKVTDVMKQLQVGHIKARAIIDEIVAEAKNVPEKVQESPVPASEATHPAMVEPGPKEGTGVPARDGGPPGPARPAPKVKAAEPENPFHGRLEEATPEQLQKAKELAPTLPETAREHLFDEINRVENKGFSDTVDKEGRFTVKPGDQLEPAQKERIKRVIEKRTYPPGQLTHGTRIDDLPNIAQEGIKVSDAHGGRGVYALEASPTGKTTLHLAVMRKKGVPAQLLLREGVKTEAVEGKVSVRKITENVKPSDIEGVYIADDPHLYTLAEAVEKLSGKRPEEAKGGVEVPPPKAQPEPGPSGEGTTPPRKAGPAKEKAAPPKAEEAPPAEEIGPSKLDEVHAKAEQIVNDAQGNWREIKWSQVDDPTIAVMIQRAPEGSTLKMALENQARIRGIRDTGDAAIEAMLKRQERRRGRKIDEGLLASPAAAGGEAAPEGRPDAEGPDPGDPVAAKSAPQQKVRLAKQGRLAMQPTSPQQMINKLARSLGIANPGIGKGFRKIPWSAGWYMSRPEVVRLRFADQLGVFAHEIGHHLHKLIFQGRLATNTRGGLDDSHFPATWRHELEAMGKALYGARQPTAGYVSEGWAEFTRFLLTDPVAAEKIAPTVYQEALPRIQTGFPEEYAALQAFQKEYEIFNRADAATKLMGYIRDKPLKLAKAPWYDRLNVMLFDRTTAPAAMLRDLKIEGLQANEDPHIAALRVRGHSTGDFEVAWSHGQFDAETGQITGPALSDIIRPVRDNLNEWQSYMAGRRALEKRAQGYKGVMPELTDQQIQTAVKQFEQTFPEFKQAAKEFQDFNRWLIGDYMVKKGLLTGEQSAKIIKANLDYITFLPVKTEEVTGAAAKMGAPPRFVETGTGVRRFPKDSGGYQIEPPLHSFLASMEGMMQRASYNEVARLISQFKHSEGAGRWVREIDRPLDMTLLRSEEVQAIIEKRLKNGGFDPDTLDKETMDAITAVVAMDDFRSFRPGFRVSATTREFAYIENGKPKFMEATNPLLYDFLKGAHHAKTIEPFWRMASVIPLAGRVFRAGATALNPAFFLANFAKDTFDAMVYTSAKGGGGIGAVEARARARWKAMVAALKTGDPGALYKWSGARQSGLFSEYVDPKTNRFKIEDMLEPPSAFPVLKMLKEGKILKAGADMARLGPIRRLNERFELATRLVEFEKNLVQSDLEKAKLVFKTEKPTAKQISQMSSLRTKGDIYRAGQAAADVTIDFQRGGTLTMYGNQIIPFFNAAFQGGNRLYRYVKNNPVEATGRIMTYIIGPSIAQMIMNRNNPQYWNMTHQERDRYWHFPLGDWDNDKRQEWIRIPKPYGLGMFAVAAERSMAALWGIDPITGKRGEAKPWEGFAGAISDSFRPPLSIPLITAAAELIANYSLFFHGPIVRKSEQQGPIEERGAERSSELAVTLGGLLGVEPPKIDYAIQGIFAGMGTEFNDNAVSPTLKVLKEDLLQQPPRASRQNKPTQLEFLPVIKRFVLEEPATNTQTLSRFWDSFTQLEDSFRGWTHRTSTDQPKQADAYYKQHQAEIEGYYNLRPYKAVMDDLFKQLNGVYRNLDLNEKQRRDQEKALVDEIMKNAREGLQNLDKLPKKK